MRIHITSYAPEARARIGEGGNQNFFENEFLATMLRGGKMADIYLLSNGILTYYTRDPDDDLTITRSDQSGYPGQRADYSSQDYPNLVNLKRIKVSKHNNQIHLISWALSQHSLAPGKRNEIIQFVGIAAETYSNKLGKKATNLKRG